MPPAVAGPIGGLLGNGGRPLVMGVLNTTPDSFSDGGAFADPKMALERAARIVEEGADLIDVGGESTRPGATAVSADEECARVIPVVEAIAARFDVPVSVDTSKPEVIRAAAGAGAAMINDVRALQLPGALDAARDTGLPVCIMHMQGEPASMQRAPRYRDPVAEIGGFLAERLESLAAAGIDAQRVVIDPGFGFGKTLEHNLDILRRLSEFAALGRPLLVGLSRKSMLKALTGRETGERLAGSLALAALAAERGANIIRTHDVAETRDVIRVTAAVCGEDI